MKTIAKLVDLLRRPFSEQLVFICVITFLLSIPDFWFFVNDGESPVLAIYLIFQSYVWAYAIAGVICLVRYRRIQRIVKILVVISLSMAFMLESTSVFQHGVRFNSDFLYILLGTNETEIGEYVETFASPRNIGSFIFSVLFVIIGFGMVLRDKVVCSAKVSNVFLAILIMGFVIIMRRNVITLYNPYYKIVSFSEYKVPPDLRKYYKNPKISFCKEGLPQNVVVIIGESLTKYHCSLYGYSKDTNPLLSKLKNDDSLIVFNHVTSPGTSTVQSFRFMMGTYKENDGKEWYDCILIPEIVEMTGYRSHWISNQAAFGMYDNIIRRYAETCSDQYFNGDLFTADQRIKSYDGDLIDIVRNTIKKDNGQKRVFTFVNLMGSHFKFGRRYPKEYNHFKANNYLDKKLSQRQTLAEYDNSVLYNDYVVYELMKAYEDKEAIVLYFPDHGLDLFYTKDDYAAHALNTPDSQKYGKAIPFMIYTTPRFQHKYPNVVERLKNSVDNEFCTGDLIYALMDIMGIRFKNNNDVESYSPFH